MPHGHGPGEQPEDIRCLRIACLRVVHPFLALPLKVLTDRRSGQAIPLTSLSLKWNGITPKTRGAGRTVKGVRIGSSFPNESYGDLACWSRVYYLNLFDARGIAVTTEHQTCNVP